MGRRSWSSSLWNKHQLDFDTMKSGTISTPSSFAN